MRLRWAKSISTFFRRFCAVTLNSDAVHWRAKSRTISYFSRWTARASELGQHFSFNAHPVPRRCESLQAAQVPVNKTNGKANAPQLSIAESIDLEALGERPMPPAVAGRPAAPIPFEAILQTPPNIRLMSGRYSCPGKLEFH